MNTPSLIKMIGELSGEHNTVLLLAEEPDLVESIHRAGVCQRRIVVPSTQGVPGDQLICLGIDIDRLSVESQLRFALLTGILKNAIDPSESVVCVWANPAGYGVDVINPLAFLGVTLNTPVWEGLSGVAGPLAHALNASLRLCRKREAGLLVLAEWSDIEPYVVPHTYDPFMGTGTQQRPALSTEDGIQVLAKFARLDYAFHIALDGSVSRLLNHIAPPPTKVAEATLWGLGSRHMTALELTEVTSAVTITVQASDGTIRVHARGREALRLRSA